MRTAAWLSVLLWSLVACTHDEQPGVILVEDLRVMGDAATLVDGVATVELDYTDALDSGFVIPSARQAPGGAYDWSFKVPSGTSAQGLRYKFYYVNTSYRFPAMGPDGAQHPLAHENFYGSFERSSEAFRSTGPIPAEGLEVKERFRIHGDPREEAEFKDDQGRSLRWARNPRVGRYGFLVVIMTEEHFQQLELPQGVMDISAKQEGRFIDPFWYWLHGPGSTDKAVQVIVPEAQLQVVARPDLGGGIHIPSTAPTNSAGYTNTCGNAPALSRTAPFEQFIHYVDPSTRFANIPLIADVLANEYTPKDHDRYKALFRAEDMVTLRPMTTPTPCATVESDPERDRIILRNPASRPGDLRKENVGIRSRHGLAYGRYRVKCKLTRLLNDSDMWVGLTNAIWLIYDGAPGCMRRPCEKDGYMQNYYGGDDDARAPRVAYSEIDFEILKTPAYCPEVSFPPTYPQPIADSDDRAAWAYSTSDARMDKPGAITVACTNWDMACHDPESFGVGCHPLTKDGRTYLNHRWSKDYRAVTQKVEELDAELFGGDHYWFEIDWRPEEITWRIGPELDQLRVVGYMDRSITEISNVQMHLIVTQEYHNTRWWPGTPYDQGFIPFPSKDLVGEIMEVIIE
ncbi:MAG: hypothetical protein KA817_02390 [Flavobacteriales bacterium]|nr:hypothetical protein [Flavobacteriales bacterium]